MVTAAVVPVVVPRGAGRRRRTAGARDGGSPLGRGASAISRRAARCWRSGLGRCGRWRLQGPGEWAACMSSGQAVCVGRLPRGWRRTEAEDE
jgi:hypothetical protein